MKYYKRTENGYIVLIGTDCGGEEITEQEYSRIMHIITNKPSTIDNYDYKLKETLEWESYELIEEEDSNEKEV